MIIMLRLVLTRNLVTICQYMKDNDTNPLNRYHFHGLLICLCACGESFLSVYISLQLCVCVSWCHNAVCVSVCVCLGVTMWSRLACIAQAVLALKMFLLQPPE